VGNRVAIARRATVLVAAASTCVFGYFAVRDVNFELFTTGLADSTYSWLFPALAALALGVWLRAVRWWLMFAPERRPPLRTTTHALLIGYFFNQLLPARAGEAARVLALHGASGTSRAEAAGTALTERAYDILSLLVLVLVAEPFMPHIPWIHRAALASIFFAIALTAAIIVVLRFEERPVSFLLRPLARLPGVSSARTNTAASSVVRGLAALHQPRLAIPALVVTFVSWLVLAVSFWCGLAAFNLGLGYDAALLVVITTNLVLVIPSAPAGLGAFEGAVVLALDPYRVDHSIALAAAVVLHGLNLFPFLAGGVWALDRQRIAVRRRAAPAFGLDTDSRKASHSV
jgi:glycosyltransferase 2 family protein